MIGARGLIYRPLATTATGDKRGQGPAAYSAASPLASSRMPKTKQRPTVTAR